MVGAFELGQRADHIHSVKPFRRHVRGAASIEERCDFGAATEFAVAQRADIDEVDPRAPVAERRDERSEPWSQTEVHTIIGDLRALDEGSCDSEEVRVARDGEAAYFPHRGEA